MSGQFLHRMLCHDKRDLCSFFDKIFGAYFYFLNRNRFERVNGVAAAFEFDREGGWLQFIRKRMAKRLLESNGKVRENVSGGQREVES